MGKWVFSLVILLCMVCDILSVLDLGDWKIGSVMVCCLFSRVFRVFWDDVSLMWVMFCNWVILLLFLVFRIILLNCLMLLSWFWEFIEIKKFEFCGMGVAFSCLADICIFCLCIVLVMLLVVIFRVVVCCGFIYNCMV